MNQAKLISSFRGFAQRLVGFPKSLSFVSGALTVLAFAPYGQAWLPPVTLAVLFALCLDATPRQALWRGWWFGIGLFAFGISWIYISLHEFGKLSPFIAGPMMLLLVAIMAAFPAVACWLGRRVSLRGSVVRQLLALAASWTLLEWVRGWFLSGFPWLSVGYSQTDTFLKGYAPVLGVFGVSLALVLLAGAIVTLLLGARRQRWGALAVVAGLLLGAWGLGHVQWTHPVGKPLKVALVQGNVPQELKWDPDAFRETLKKYAKLSQGHWNADVVIWPEAAIPGLYRQVENGYLPAVEKVQKNGGAAWLTGVLAADPGMENYYNTVMEAGDPPKFYVKRHLVPFGEYFPVPKTVRRWLRLMNLPYTDFTPGDSEQALLHIKGVPVSVSICYEVVFGRVIRHDLPAAQVLINVSNDAWFGDSIGPEQHFQIARMRAIEAGRYLVRGTNTGVTAIVNSDGRVLRRAPREQALVMEGLVEPRAGATPWVRLGNLLTLALIIVAYGLMWLVGGRASSK